MAIGSVVPDGRCNYVVYDENGNYKCSVYDDYFSELAGYTSKTFTVYNPDTRFYHVYDEDGGYVKEIYNG